MIKKRRRGTAIVESDKGILVAAGKRKIFLLPGGAPRKSETRLHAAVRELHEETGLHAYSVRYLFSFVGPKHKSYGGGYFQDHHKVFLVESHGHCRPRHEVKHVAWYTPKSKIKLSRTTKQLIDRYYGWKRDALSH